MFQQAKRVIIIIIIIIITTTILISTTCSISVSVLDWKRSKYKWTGKTNEKLWWASFEQIFFLHESWKRKRDDYSES